MTCPQTVPLLISGHDSYLDNITVSVSNIQDELDQTIDCQCNNIDDKPEINGSNGKFINFTCIYNCSENYRFDEDSNACEYFLVKDLISYNFFLNWKLIKKQFKEY